MWRRLKVVVVGLAVGALFALWVVVALMPSGWCVQDRALIWAAVMGGPVVGTAWGMAEYHPQVSFGWLGLFLIPAHPIRPHWATGVLTVIGLMLWLFAGFVAVIVGAWGG